RGSTAAGVRSTNRVLADFRLQTRPSASTFSTRRPPPLLRLCYYFGTFADVLRQERKTFIFSKTLEVFSPWVVKRLGARRGGVVPAPTWLAHSFLRLTLLDYGD